MPLAAAAVALTPEGRARMPAFAGPRSAGHLTADPPRGGPARPEVAPSGNQPGLHDRDLMAAGRVRIPSSLARLSQPIGKRVCDLDAAEADSRLSESSALLT